MGVRRTTEVATFRMPKDRLDALKEEAESQGLTANALINKIVERYLDFHLLAEHTGLMPFPRRLLTTMISQLDEKSISSLAKTAAEVDVPDIVYMKSNKFTMKYFIDVLLSWAKESGFTYKSSYEDNVRTITIHHNMGQKWSKFIAQTIELTARKLREVASFEISDDFLVIQITSGI